MARAAAAAAEADENLHGRPLEDSDAAPTPTDAANKSDADADGPASKKRKIAAGARGVANLTPEQLAKKRANGEFPPRTHHIYLYMPTDGRCAD